MKIREENPPSTFRVIAFHRDSFIYISQTGRGTNTVMQLICVVFWFGFVDTSEGRNEAAENRMFY